MDIQQKICDTIDNAKKITVKIIGFKRTWFKRETKFIAGSGFYFKKNYILTNYHVIEGFYKIKIGVYGDTELFDAKVIGHDKYLDICVLETSRSTKFLLRCNSHDLKEGYLVVSMGMPQGLEFTSTIGMISSLNHSIHLENNEVITEVIQLNNYLSLGNSGGPLLNIYSEIIGMNTLSLFNTDNISFAIKINFVLKIANNIINEVKK